MPEFVQSKGRLPNGLPQDSEKRCRCVNMQFTGSRSLKDDFQVHGEVGGNADSVLKYFEDKGLSGRAAQKNRKHARRDMWMHLSEEGEKRTETPLKKEKETE